MLLDTEKVKPSFWSWKRVISNDQIKTLNTFIENNYDHKGEDMLAARDENNKVKKNNYIYNITYGKITPYIHGFVDMAKQINRDNFGYHLNEMLLQDNVILNVYDESIQASYDWHSDGSPSPYSDIKLTILINISNVEYQGGEFMMFLGDKYTIHEFSEPGDMIMFRSNIYHAVKPVTKGQRRTLALFLMGPTYK